MDRASRFTTLPLIAWLGMTHFLAAVSVLIVWHAPAQWSPTWRWVAALGVGVTFGVMASGPLLRGVELLTSALEQLAHGRPIAALPPVSRRLQPLHRLLILVDALGARERELGRLRDDLVRSTGDAAAQVERNRLARELHDSIKQQLYGINVSAAAALARWEHDLAGARAAVEDVRHAAQAALAEMAALLQQLRPAPLAAAGLLDALREQCEALAHRTGAEVTVDLGAADEAAAYAAALDSQRLAPGAEEAIFRISQEALNNVARHARAQHVRLRLRVEGETLRLQITDDGQGFTPADRVAEAPSSGYGLAGMRDRALAIGATVEVASAPGSGTRIALNVRLGQSSAQREAELSAELKASLQAATTWQAVLVGVTLMGLVVAQGWLPRLTAGSYSPGGMAFSVALLVISVVVGRLAWDKVRRAHTAVALACGADSAAAWRLRRETAWARVSAGITAAIILPSAFLPASYPHYPLLAIAAGAACALFVLLTVSQAYRATEQYWTRLTGAMLVAELDQAWRQRYSWLLLLLALIAGYFIYRSGFGAPWPPFVWPPSSEMVYDVMAAIVMNLTLVAVAVNYLQLRNWRMKPAASAR